MAAREVDLSVVIVTHNVERLIGACLESLLRECDSLATEVFVVDSASSDRTVETVKARFPAVDVAGLRENVGFSAGNNHALVRCTGRNVLLLNPDTIVTAGAIRALAARLESHPEAGAVGPTLRTAKGGIQVECARNLPRPDNMLQWLLLLDKLEWSLRFGKRARSDMGDPPQGTLLDRFNLLAWARGRTCAVESICGACMMIRGDVRQAVGLLDETTPMYLDDIDYCRRILDTGRQIHYVAEATVVHLGGESTGQYRRAGDLYAMQCHAIWIYMRKHHGEGGARAFSVMVAVASVLRLALASACVLLTWGAARAFWRRQLDMVCGLARWAFRWPRSAPRFGFASERR